MTSGVRRLKGPPSLEEQRGYARGYQAGKRHSMERADAAECLLRWLVDGLATQGLSADDILDAQLLGAKARSPTHETPS